MKKYLLSSIRITLVLLVLLCVIYPLVISFVARFSAGKGDGETITFDGKVVGYALIGQSFTSPEYFWGRPSAVDYNAAGSAGSNKGPSNQGYLQEVKNRVDTLLKYHPGAKASDIPADLVTASGSGLDPDISPAAAMFQLGRVAAYRKLDESKVRSLVEEYTTTAVLGPKKVNVLKLNLALIEASK